MCISKCIRSLALLLTAVSTCTPVYASTTISDLDGLIGCEAPGGGGQPGPARVSRALWPSFDGKSKAQASTIALYLGRHGTLLKTSTAHYWVAVDRTSNTWVIGSGPAEDTHTPSLAVFIVQPAAKPDASVAAIKLTSLSLPFGISLGSSADS